MDLVHIRGLIKEYVKNEWRYINGKKAILNGMSAYSDLFNLTLEVLHILGGAENNDELYIEVIDLGCQKVVKLAYT